MKQPTAPRQHALPAFLALSCLWLMPPAPVQGQGSTQYATHVVVPDTSLNRELEHAVRHHDVRRVRLLLNAGADANTVTYEKGQDQRYPLWYLASIRARNEIQRHAVFAMIAARVVDVNTPAADNRTLLATAVDFDDFALVKHLVEHGANVNQLSGSYAPFPPLLDAIGSGGDRTDLTPTFSYLLDAGADPNLPPGIALMNAAMLGKSETVRRLLSRGADPTVRDQNGMTALRWAAVRRSAATVALLRDVTPLDLHEAAQFGVLAKVRERLDAGDALDLPDKKGKTPLMAAIEGGRKEAAVLLLDRGAKVDARDKEGRTALHYAARYGLSDLVILLLKEGADINAATTPEEEGSAPSVPLTAAISRAHADVVALLLQRGAQFPQNSNALEWLLRGVGKPIRRVPGVLGENGIGADRADDNRWRILELLTKAGGSKLVRNNHSNLLFIAASMAQVDVVTYLLDHGADVNARDQTRGFPSHGETALMGALEAWGTVLWEQNAVRRGVMSGPTLRQLQENEQYAKATVEALLRRGANVHLPDANGKTPLLLARELKLPKAVQLLKTAGAK